MNGEHLLIAESPASWTGVFAAARRRPGCQSVWRAPLERLPARHCYRWTDSPPHSSHCSEHALGTSETSVVMCRAG